MHLSSSSSASSSTSSDTDERTTTTTRLRAPSDISRDTQQSGSRSDAASGTNTIKRTSIVETATIRSSSPAPSYSSAVATGTPYDTISLATTTNTGFTSNAASQQRQSGSIPVIAPPALEQQQQQQQQQQRIGIDVVAAHQQYQQRAVPPEISPFSGSTVSSTSGSLSSPGSTYVRQQPRVDVANATVNPVDKTREQPQQGYTTSGQFHSQYQFPDQIPLQQAHNEPDEYKDVVLNIDYGAMEAYNIALQSDEFTGGQQASNMPANEQRFDVAKAIFNQVDTNRDGKISREEFQRWAQGNQQHVGGAHAHTNNYESTMGNNNDRTQLFAGATPDIANILQQSGLGQALGNFR